MSRSDWLSPGSLALVIGLFVVGACATVQHTSADAISAIAAERSAFWDAHEEGNSQKLAGFFAEDGVFWAQGARAFNGPVAIGAAAKGLFAAQAITDFKIESHELQVHRGVAYELTTISHNTTPRGGQPALTRARYLLVWKQGAGARWQIHRLMTHTLSGAR